MSDDLENRLRAAFRAARTPRASSALRDAVRRIPLDEGAPGRRSHARRITALRLAGALAAAAVVVAAVVLLPSMGGGWLGQGSSGPSDTSAPPSPGASQASPSAVGTFPPSSAPASAPSTGSVAPALPADFAPSSVSFVSAGVGWAAGTGSCDGGTCLWVLRTTDGGQTWAVAGTPRPDPGASIGLPTSIRFADALDGWLYGVGLWATHDGGDSWVTVTIPGVAAGTRVRDLASADGMVYAALLDDSGTVRVAGSPAVRDAWRLDAATLQAGAGPVPAPQIVLSPTVPAGTPAGSGGPAPVEVPGSAAASTPPGTGWLIEVDRDVVGGLRLSGTGWTTWSPPCLGTAGPTVLASSGATTLYALCDVGVWSTPEGIDVRVSDDDGTSFRTLPGKVPLGSLQAVAASGSTIVAAGNDPAGSAVGGVALVASFDAGRTWSRVGPDGLTGAVVDLAFSDPLHAVAVSATTGTGGRLLRTEDGGRTWTTVAFGGG